MSQNHFHPNKLVSIVFAAAMALAVSINTAHSQPPKPHLVVRDQVRLTLAGAQLAIVAARTKAVEIGVKENIAVVDDGGHLLAFARMDGARPGSVATSITKATSAATKRGETGPLPNAEAANTHLSLAVENAAFQSGGMFTTLLGGIPIVIDGQVIGAVGVGGATGEQDAQVARAGVDAITQSAAENSQATKSGPTGNGANEKNTPMIYRKWLVEDIEAHGVIDKAQTTLQVGKDGTVSGSTAVNRYNGTAKINGDTIEFGPLVTTRRAGPPALMDQESRFIAAMQRVRQFKVDSKGLLRLLNANGTQLLRLSPIDE